MNRLNILLQYNMLLSNFKYNNQNNQYNKYWVYKKNQLNNKYKKNKINIFDKKDIFKDIDNYNNWINSLSQKECKNIKIKTYYFDIKISPIINMIYCFFDLFNNIKLIKKK